MPLETYTRGTLITEYINRETARLQRQKAQTGFSTLTQEPASALFVTGIEVETQGVLDEVDVLKARVRAKVTGHWRPEALMMMERLKAKNIDILEFARSGGVYARYPVKRIARWKRYQAALIHHVPAFWQLPWWAETGRPMMHRLIGIMSRQTINNVHRAAADPGRGLLIGDKPPQTGTGYDKPIDKRDSLDKNIRMFEDRCLQAVESYYEGYDAAIDVWPEQDCLWRLSTDIFSGIFGGSRSDTDVVDWQPDNSYIVDSQAREVGNTPPSPFHNKLIDPKNFRQDLFLSISTPVHEMPYRFDTMVTAMTTPPVTMLSDMNREGTLALDFGFVTPAARLEMLNGKLHLIQSTEHVKLGADNIVFSGMMCETAARKWIALLKSGQPDTAYQYQITAGHGIYQQAKEAGIPIKLRQWGDDIFIGVKPADAPSLLNRLGNFARTKGTTDNSIFAGGHRIIWDDEDHLTSLIMPRAMKTVSSAKMIKKKLKDLKPIDKDGYVLDSDIVDSISAFYRDYEGLVYFEGSPDDYKSYLKGAIKAYSVLWEHGVAEWMKDIFTED